MIPESDYNPNAMNEIDARHDLTVVIKAANLTFTDMMLIRAAYDGEQLKTSANELGLTYDNARQRLARARKKIQRSVTGLGIPCNDNNHEDER